MGRNRSSGCRSLSQELFRHVEEVCKLNYSTVGQIVECLRATYPIYGRQKVQPFTARVEEALERIHIRNTTLNKKSSNPGCLSTPSPPHKKIKKIDRSEERLQQMETQHILRRQQGLGNLESSSSASTSSSSSSDEVEDGAVSTSEDAIYSEKLEPEFDLMKSMLRASYSDTKSAAKTNVPTEEKEKLMEVEVVNNKSKKLDLIKGDKIDTNSDRHGAKTLNGSGFGGEMNGKREPMFEDLGGISGLVEQLVMEVIIPLKNPWLPEKLGVRPITGILLHGPPGCGKTKLAQAIANEAEVPLHKISATELVSGISGASEENIRELFSKAYRTSPSIVFIDEIDAVASKRENLQREMERRIVTQLMICMDESHRHVQPADANSNSEGSASGQGYVLVVGATNRPDALDPALRRPGRFDREYDLGAPDEIGRIEILSVILRAVKVQGAFDVPKIARSTPGFVGADLKALVNKAGNLAMKRIIDQRKSEVCKEPLDGEHKWWWRHQWLVEENETLGITMDEFEEAAKTVQPSSRREGFSAIPDVTWEHVGGLDLLRQEFIRYIVGRIKYPDVYKEFGVDLETGFLLYGPPGCGKTLIAKAVTNEAGANFIHIKGPELLNKYVGESELAVRTIFSRARTCAPCILFFDEVDALTTRRGKEGGWVVERLLNQLLIELDGADQRQGVYVIGATNRPEVMDPALLRPGRFGKLIYVPLPGPQERGMILKALARRKPIDLEVDLMALGRNELFEGLSGADLKDLVNEAAMLGINERLASKENNSDKTVGTIRMTHFEQASKNIRPSVRKMDIQHYQRFADSFRAT